MVTKSGQMKIQQMAFMILAVFFFFILAGLFVLNIGLKDLKKEAGNLQEEGTISSLEVIANMPELNCDSKKSLCLDKDKVRILSERSNFDYESFWPVASIKVYEIYPPSTEQLRCPQIGCNFYEIWDNNQSNKKEFSTFISLCETIKETGFVYDSCTIGKLVVGTKINE